MFLIYFHSCFVMNIKLFLNVRRCHIPFVLRACKNLCCICGGTNRDVIPVKYGRELALTRYMHPLQVLDLWSLLTAESNEMPSRWELLERIQFETSSSAWDEEIPSSCKSQNAYGLDWLVQLEMKGILHALSFGTNVVRNVWMRIWFRQRNLWSWYSREKWGKGLLRNCGQSLDSLSHVE